jgi:hypothetical protein
VTDREAAQRFLDDYRAAHGSSTTPLPRAAVTDLIERMLRESYTPEQAKDPLYRNVIEGMFDRAVRDGVDAAMFDFLTKRQGYLEAATVEWTRGLDLDKRPLLGHLRTGQLNAVSMPVPDSDGYLVVFEDQMVLFLYQIGNLAAWAVPTDPSNDRSFRLSVPDVTARIDAVPEIAAWFADIIVSYAVTGTIGLRYSRNLPPGYARFAGLRNIALLNFVLGHEYAHVIMGHLDKTDARRGVLPVPDHEALVYSWRQEIEADQIGTMLSLNTCMDHDKLDFGNAFLGIGLFLDILDVMDRAVALLETGDENARQLGSHPPAHLRKQRVREFLTKLADADPEQAENVSTALAMDDVHGQIIGLLWDRTRPILLDQRERGVRPAGTWRTIPRETAPLRGC